MRPGGLGFRWRAKSSRTLPRRPIQLPRTIKRRGAYPHSLQIALWHVRRLQKEVTRRGLFVAQLREGIVVASTSDLDLTILLAR